MIWDVTNFTAFKILENILFSYLFKSLHHHFRHFYNIVIMLSVDYTVIAKTHKCRVFEMYDIIATYNGNVKVR